PSSVYRRSVASRAASVILSQRKARISGPFSTRSTYSALPAMMPACGPPRSLSPLNSTTSAPAVTLSRAPGPPLPPHPAPARERVDPRELVPPAQLDQPRQGHRFGEAAYPVVARMDAQQRPRLGADGVLVVGEARDIGRAHLT